MLPFLEFLVEWFSIHHHFNAGCLICDYQIEEIFFLVFVCLQFRFVHNSSPDGVCDNDLTGHSQITDGLRLWTSKSRKFLNHGNYEGIICENLLTQVAVSVSWKWKHLISFQLWSNTVPFTILLSLWVPCSTVRVTMSACLCISAPLKPNTLKSYWGRLVRQYSINHHRTWT